MSTLSWEIFKSDHLALNQRRAAESAAARKLLNSLIPFSENDLQKDEHGKPFLQSHPRAHISISHGGGFVAAIVSEYPCGVDVESCSDRVLRIRERFLNDSEKEWLGMDVDKLTAAWSAKESVYKAWGKRQLDFARDIHLSPHGEDRFSVRVLVPEKELKALVYIHWLSNAVLTWVEFPMVVDEWV